MRVRDLFIKKSKTVGCCHDVLSDSSTLIKSPKRTMVHPEHIQTICSVCHKQFTFIKDGATYTLVKEDI